MKEHALFLRAGFTPVNADFSKQAEMFKNEFQKLLCDAVILSNGVVSQNVLNSGEIVTEFTFLAEKQTEHLTGIEIDKAITAKELRLKGNLNRCNSICAETVCAVKKLNKRALSLLDGLIRFKENILNNVTCCKMFTANYPLLIEHIIREAKLYRQYLQMLETNGDLSCQSMKEIESFKLRDFKAAGTKGIEECTIRSIILPLLADHVLREANHYIRLLEEKNL